MKVFVTGVSGQLGHDVMNELHRCGIEGVGSDIAPQYSGIADGSAATVMPYVALDITDKSQVERVLYREKPDAVIHCAAWTAVDAAEDEDKKPKVYAVNVQGTENIAAICKTLDCKMMYISTDYVFDGQGEDPWQPDCKDCAPLNYYGETKLGGELAVSGQLEKFFIVRTSWAFGANGKNFISAMLDMGKTHDSVRVVNDQIGTPTYTPDLARLLVDMIATEKYGYYHATNEGGYISWYEFAREIFRQAGYATRVVPVTTAEYGLSAAARPFNSRLDRSKLKESGFSPLPVWRDALDRYLTEKREKRKMKKKVVVTGAGGYIGRHVVKALCDMGAEVIAVDFVTNGIDERAKTMVYDIFSGSKTIYQDLGCPDVCLHMAWKDGFVHNSDAHMEFLSRHYAFVRDMVAGGLKQIAVMGTMHEVGYHEGAIDENTPCNPTSMYGVAKDALRRSMFLLLKDKDVCLQWLRAYYICGDDKRAVSIFGKIVQAAEEGKSHFPFTSGKNLYDFIDVDELSHQIAAAVMQTEVDGIINCCTGEPMSLAEKVESFIKEHHFNIQLDYGAFPDRPYDSPGVWGDATKINRIMGK